MKALFDDALFRQLPIVGILRAFPRAQVEGMVPAVLAGGLRNIEVTLNSPGADALIRWVGETLGNRGNVGAGTVTTLAELERALAAGACFIVTPTVVPEVIRACVQRGVPVMPGAVTPSEILAAWRLGANRVKIFPAESLGPDYVRAINETFPDISLMPTGGVTVETLGTFRQAGARAFGVGSPLFDPGRSAAGDWDWFRRQADRFREAWLGSAAAEFVGGSE